MKSIKQKQKNQHAFLRPTQTKGEVQCGMLHDNMNDTSKWF